MKCSFHTTLIDRKIKPQNRFIGFIYNKFKVYSSMCILGLILALLQAFT